MLVDKANVVSSGKTLMFWPDPFNLGVGFRLFQTFIKNTRKEFTAITEKAELHVITPT